MTQNARALRRNFRWRYITALVILAVLACSTMFLSVVQLQQQDGRGDVVHIASNQKALSQRISFFVNAIASGQNTPYLRSELRKNIDQMRRAHNVLSMNAPDHVDVLKAMPEIQDIYYNDISPFDLEVRYFLELAESFAKEHGARGTHNQAVLTEINLLGTQTLMQTHDVIAHIITHKSQRDIVDAVNFQALLTLAILFLLVVESVLIFEPMGFKIAQSVRRAEISEHKAHQQATKARNADAAKTNFLRVMSHEIRTPLNAVLGMSKLMRAEPLSSVQSTYLGHIADAGQQMLSLANDILTLNQSGANRLEVQPNDHNLKQELTSITELMQPKAAEKDLQLSLTVRDELDGEYSFDRLRLRQIILNLIGNAIKFTDDGSIRVRTSWKNTSGADEDKTAAPLLQIRVEDTGIGIPEDRRGAIFDEFEQAHMVGERSYGGAGLGLAISRKIAVAMGGSLELESSGDDGSCFLLILPLPKAQAAQHRPEDKESPDTQPGAAEDDANKPTGLEQKPNTTKPTNVLVVDDNLPNRMIAATFLRQAGFLVQTAEDGQDALNLISENAQSPFDLIFMDIEMPKIDGVEATKKIRAEAGALSKTPVIALTAHALQNERDRFIAAGFNDVMRKPIAEQDLISCAKTYLARSKAA